MSCRHTWPLASWMRVVLLVGSSNPLWLFPVGTNRNANLASAPIPTEQSSSRTSSSPAILARVGWKTFISTEFQVAVDYPQDWSVSEEESRVTFRSKPGGVIQLSVIETGQLSPENFLKENLLPNTRCSSKTNAAGISVRICFDTLSGSYSAEFILKSQLLSLSMPKRGDTQVFNLMVESLRPQQ